MTGSDLRFSQVASEKRHSFYKQGQETHAKISCHPSHIIYVRGVKYCLDPLSWQPSRAHRRTCRQRHWFCETHRCGELTPGAACSRFYHLVDKNATLGVGRAAGVSRLGPSWCGWLGVLSLRSWLTCWLGMTYGLCHGLGLRLSARRMAPPPGHTRGCHWWALAVVAAGTPALAIGKIWSVGSHLRGPGAWWWCSPLELDGFLGRHLSARREHGIVGAVWTPQRCSAGLASPRCGSGLP